VTIQRSKFGLVIKAGIDDRERTEMLGVHLKRVNVIIMAIGSALAAISGILAAPILGAGPNIGGELLIISFAIIIVGGLGDIRGAIAAGLLVGIVSSLMSFFYPRLANISIFALMVVVLITRPRGLLKGAEA